MNVVMQKFRTLSEREQRLVILSCVVIVIGAFYWGIWSPLNTSLTQQQALLNSQQKLLTWVQDSANRAQQLRRSGTGPASFNGSLPQAVNQTTNRHNITISRMQPQGEELQVWVDQAPFNDVLAWLQTMEKMGIVILQADIAEADDAGYIKIRRLQLGKS